MERLVYLALVLGAALEVTGAALHGSLIGILGGLLAAAIATVALIVGTRRCDQ